MPTPDYVPPPENIIEPPKVKPREPLRIRSWHVFAFKHDGESLYVIDFQSDYTRDGPDITAFLERYRDRPGRLSHVIGIFHGGEWL